MTPVKNTKNAGHGASQKRTSSTRKKPLKSVLDNDHNEGNKKNLFLMMLGILISGALFMGIVGNMGSDSLKTSVLSIFNRIGITDYVEEYPDLGIDKVTLVKMSDPTSSFPYYKYKANILVTNYGELLEKANIVLTSGPNQKTAFVRNELYGLTLDKGEKFMFDDYEVLMDQSLNFKSFEFNLDPKDVKDKDFDNNSYVVEVLEDVAEIQTFDLNSYATNGMHQFSFLPSQDLGEDIDEMKVEICVAEGYEGISDEELRYSEIDTKSFIYSYYKASLAADHLATDKFECVAFASSYKFDLDKEYAVYLRSFDLPRNGATVEGEYALSDILYLPTSELLTRANYAKYFLEFSGMEKMFEGESVFQDVSAEDWYAPYVQAMFNHGLIKDSYKFEFAGEDAIMRAEVLEPVLNYFDVDLRVQDGAPHFHDVQEGSEYYYFAESLYAADKGHGLGIYLHPEQQVSKHYLKYLIDEFEGWEI